MNKILVEFLLLFFVIVVGFVGVALATNPKENQDTVGFKIMGIAVLMAAALMTYIYILGQ